jgi:hypothetical protein
MSDKNFKKGFLIISRGLFEHSLWQEKRVLSKYEAWVDIIQTAGFENSSLLVGYKKIELQRGELVGSLRYFSER